jgi:hypothetical protein
MNVERPTKTCPECAETVLAAARKCRFCGYRFDGVGEPSPRRPSGGMLGLFRRTGPPPTLRELLAEWGISPDDEATTTLHHATIDGATGFIVLTRSRFYFVSVTSSSVRIRAREEHLLQDLLRVHIRRYRLRRALFIEWQDQRTIVETTVAQLAELQDLLSPYAIGADRDDDGSGPA